MVDAMIPVLSPAGVQEILDFGLIGWALSRYSGCWVGIKCVKDTVEATASIDVDVDRVRIVPPQGVELPTDGLNLRQSDTPHAQEARLHRHKLDAVKAFARANAIDRVVVDGDRAMLGIITHGKSYLDVLQALHDLDLTEEQAGELDYAPAFQMGHPIAFEFANRLVDIGKSFDTKVRSLLCHSSQIEMLAGWFVPGADPTRLSDAERAALEGGARGFLEMMARGMGQLSPKVELGEAFYALKVGPGHFDNYQEMFMETAGVPPGPPDLV